MPATAEDVKESHGWNPHARLLKNVETVSTQGGIGPDPDAREINPIARRGGPKSEQNGEHNGAENPFSDNPMQARRGPSRQLHASTHPGRSPGGRDPAIRARL